MAEYEQIMRALRNAHAAGDTAAAQRLAQMAQAARGQAAAPRERSQPNPDGTYGQPPEGMVFDENRQAWTGRELMANNLPSSRGRAVVDGGLQGMSFGWADEAAGAVGGEFERERARARLDASQRDFPGTTMGAEVTGAVLAPGGAVGRAKTFVGNVARGATAGGFFGGLYGGGTAEEGERGGGAMSGAGFGALFGGAASGAINIGTRSFQRLFGRSQQRPTVDNLRAARSAAYKAVDEAGESVPQTQMQALRDRVHQELADPTINFVPEADTKTVAALRMIDSIADGNMTLGQLDRVRRRLWDRAKAAPDEIGIRRMIDAVDDAIMSSETGGGLMQAARLSHQRFKKAELLEEAFERATRQTGATGSGGNTFNNYRRAVNRILNSERNSKWFSPEELQIMQQFIQGDASANLLRRIGKLSPSGNGLMLALNMFGSATFGAPALAVGAAGAAAKHAADRGIRDGAEGLMTRMATGTERAARPPVQVPLGVNALAGAAGGGLFDQ